MKPEELIKFISSFGLTIDDVSMSYNSEGDLTYISVYMSEDDEEEFDIETFINPEHLKN